MRDLKKKFPILIFTQICLVGPELFHANIYIYIEDRSDGRTYMTKLRVNFCNF